MLDDRIDLGTRGDEEFAQARYRDNYLWLRRAALRDSGWRSTTGLAFTSATRTRQGELRRADLIRGDLSERRSIENLQFSSDWSSATVRSRSFDLGVELAGMRAPYRSTRVVDLAPQLANTFGVISHSALDAQARPRALSLAAYAAVRQHGSALEAEFGLRLDQQRYDPGPTATQLSPRLNLRLELARQWRAYGSLGRFTQAQRVDEWRAEEGQVRPDRGQSAIHAVVGLARDRGDAVRWRIELYDKRWTAKSAYFDSRLDPLALLPDLAPDRVRLAPLRAEARGAELSVRTRLTPTLEAWANASVARVVDDLQDGETVRSWDQPWALTAGLAHTGPRVSVAALLGWHRGWPRTPLQATPPLLGARNSQRWANYFTVDLRADWTRALANGQLSTFAEITNGTNRFNECCADLEMALPGSGAPEFERNQWLPIVVNLGIAFRWHGGARGARSSAPQAASTARDRP